MPSHYSMDPERWAKALSGEGCPFCAPRPDQSRFWTKVATLSRSTLDLSRDQRFAGRCVLIYDLSHAVGLAALVPCDARALFEDLRRCCAALERATSCALLNVASLGNQIAHLHWHLIPRSESDPRWGGPPWTTHPDDVPGRSIPEPELDLLARAIEAELALV